MTENAKTTAHAKSGRQVGGCAFVSTETARRFTHAYRASREWANRSAPDNIAAAEADYFREHAPQAVSRAIETYQQSGSWGGDIQIPKDLYENALNVFEYSGLITRRHPYESVVAPPPQ